MANTLPLNSPTVRLLLDCLHHNAGRITAARLRALSGNQWDAILSLALKHRVAPLLYDRLKRLGLKPDVPEKVFSSLRHRYLHSAGRNLQLFTELKLIIETFRAEDIPVIVLKGAYLAQAVYRNIALREMNDLDLLVPTDQLAQAGSILIAEGYSPRRQYNSALEVAISQHLPCFHKRTGANIELHWNITNPLDDYAIDPAELWQRSNTMEKEGSVVQCLSFEDLLLHLCLHASYQHRFEFGLRPICDIAEIMADSGMQIEWDLIVNRAIDWKWRNGTFFTLYLAHHLLGAAVPLQVLNTLAPKKHSHEILRIVGTLGICQGQNKRLVANDSGRKLRLKRTVTASLGAFSSKYLGRDDFSRLLRASSEPTTGKALHHFLLRTLTNFYRRWRVNRNTVLEKSDLERILND